jgi:hypothetical protein
MSTASIMGMLNDILKDSDDLFAEAVQVYQKRLKLYLNKSITTNQNVSGFCSLPDSFLRLDTRGGEPSYLKHNRIPESLHSVVDTQLQSWLDSGILIPNTVASEWNNPLLVVPKKDKEGKTVAHRVCIDPRPLNRLLPSINYPLPLIKSIFEDLKESRVFTRLDLKSSFTQFQVHPDDREKVTITWKGKYFKFKGIPFGLKPTPSFFQHRMSLLFVHLPFVKVYMDDIFTHSRDFTEHWDHVKQVLEILNNANLKVNFEKSAFGQISVEFLGFLISPSGVHVIPEKVLSLQNWNLPRTGNDLEKHLGFFNYFRDLIPRYAEITAPLEKLSKVKDLASIWNDDLTAIYEKLKLILSSELVLSFPDFSRPFYVGTDASKNGLGAVLYQKTDDDTVKYICFASRALTPGEKGAGYGITERELEAVIFALQHFEYYVYGRRFTLYTDHQALTYMFTQKHTNAALNRRLAILLDFDFNIIHLPGIHNILPDKLSRLYDCEENLESEEPTIWNTEVALGSFEPFSDDPILDVELRKVLLIRAHLLGHFGANSMVKALQVQGKIWPTMRAEAKELVLGCIECQRWNIGHHGFHPLTPISAQLPWDYITMD